jgi:small-conductance mechanosensitive channel
MRAPSKQDDVLTKRTMILLRVLATSIYVHSRDQLDARFGGRRHEDFSPQSYWHTMQDKAPRGGRALTVARRIVSCAHALLAAAALLAGSTSTSPALAADALEKPAAAATTPVQSAESKAHPVPSLAEILIAAEHTETLEHEVRKRFGDMRRLTAAEENIAAIEAAVARAADAVDPTTSERLQVLALIDLAMEIRTYIERVRSTANALEARARAYDGDLDRIDAMRRQWSERIEAARKREAPEQLLQRIDPVPQRLAALAREVTERRNANLVLLDRVTRLRGRMGTMLNEAVERRDRLVADLSDAAVEPLWQARAHGDTTQLAHAWLSTELAQLHGYVARHWDALLLLGGIGFVVGVGVTMAARRTLASEARADDDSAIARRLFGWPPLTALALVLMLTLWQAPEAPVVFYSATLTLLFVVSAVLARIALGYEALLTLYVLGAAVLLNWFQAGFDALPYSGRVLLMVQCAAVAAALWIDLRHGRMDHPPQLLPPPAMRLVAYAATALLVIAIIASVLGDIGLARQLRDGVLRTLGFALVINVQMRILVGLILALLGGWASQWSRIVQYRAATIRAAILAVTRLVAVATWIFGAMLSFKVFGFMDWVQDAVSDAKIEIGSVTISADAVLLSIGVLIATWVIVKSVRLLLELELLSRLTLSSATSFVVSATVRYLLTVAGLILAMAALGIDFSRVTLLISAIGVGIGFGLQNVVNNFVSGLLLLGERVINVGDTVQVGSLRGVVRRIGVRSSTVRTPLGAEVIVPNSDLTSKEVVNFTLSDRHRRLDITVGVDYGSDPDQVVERLLDAAKAQPAVLRTPAPVAAFVGFGESALDFRLQAWIADYEEGLSVETALRMAILARLREAGIGIPFPQREINIRQAPAPAGRGPELPQQA